jgi:phosphosulfolactate synthase
VATQMSPIGGAHVFRDARRTQKPRKIGLTQVLDKGLSSAEVEGMLEVAESYVDVVKFGWATSVVVENFEAKLETFRRHGIAVCCGGSLFELAVHRKMLNEYVSFLQDHDFKHVEVSDGTIVIPLAEKLRYIERLAKHFTVFSEVGRKDRTHVVAPKRWVDQIKSEISAGSWKVIVEGRESGTVGIYHSSGEIKAGLIDEIQMNIDTGRIIFEAPRKPQQVWFIKHFGPNVNLGNIPPEDVISVETIRQGLRADTLLFDHDGRATPPPAERRTRSTRAHSRH